MPQEEYRTGRFLAYDLYKWSIECNTEFRARRSFSLDNNSGSGSSFRATLIHTDKRAVADVADEQFPSAGDTGKISLLERLYHTHLLQSLL